MYAYSEQFELKIYGRFPLQFVFGPLYFNFLCRFNAAYSMLSALNEAHA